VLERTREIGIRRAIGATRKDIMGQFLFEAALLSFLGGMIGIILGWSMSYVITLYAGWKTIVSIFSVILAFGVSAAVGILFGFYPARQAALMDPIESLRYE
ncbi:MAG: ABC transporter permease, partial [bacterium]